MKFDYLNQISISIPVCGLRNVLDAGTMLGNKSTFTETQSCVLLSLNKHLKFQFSLNKHLILAIQL